jgi:type IV pilus assembly protein PilN
MIRINLLPVRQSRRQEAAKRELILLGVGAGLVLFVCAVLYILVLARVNEVRSDTARVERQLEELRAMAAKVDELSKVNEELKRKLAIIDELQKNRVGPVHLLDEVSAATPEKLYLTSLKERDGKVNLAGYAASNEIISQFLINLEKSPWFDEVILIIIEQQKKDGLNLRSFQITARIVVPSDKDEKAAATEGGELIPSEGEQPLDAPPPPAAADAE